MTCEKKTLLKSEKDSSVVLDFPGASVREYEKAPVKTGAFELSNVWKK
jgi:hypothetical protein